MGIARLARAKINLALAVGPPIASGRPNAGMHPIASWMHAIDLADTVAIEPADNGIHLNVRWAPDAPRPTPIDWPPEKDLCVRAAHAVSEATSTPINVRITIEKRIPVGAGLGGGSSDAAATLLALNNLLRLNLPLEKLHDISSALGSDIAFFLDGPNPPRPALVTALGNEIDRIDPHRPGAPIQAGSQLILCIPPFSCATGPVYRAFDTLDHAPLRESEVRQLALAPASADLFNDLAPAADRVAPELPILRASIANELNAPVHVTGSGSALFSFASPIAITHLKRTFPEVAFIATSLV